MVLAANGYPGEYIKNAEVKNLNLENNFYVAALEEKENKWYSTGGRVLLAYGRGKNVKEAKNNAYKEIEKIESPKLYYRKDIGNKSLEKNKNKDD